MVSSKASCRPVMRAAGDPTPCADAMTVIRVNANPSAAAAARLRHLKLLVWPMRRPFPGSLRNVGGPRCTEAMGLVAASPLLPRHPCHGAAIRAKGNLPRAGLVCRCAWADAKVIKARLAPDAACLDADGQARSRPAPGRASERKHGFAPLPDCRRPQPRSLALARQARVAAHKIMWGASPPGPAVSGRDCSTATRGPFIHTIHNNLGKKRLG